MLQNPAVRTEVERLEREAGPMLDAILQARLYAGLTHAMPDCPLVMLAQRQHRQHRLKRRQRKKQRVGEFTEWGIALTAQLHGYQTEALMDAWIDAWLGELARLGLCFGGGFQWQTGTVDGVVSVAGRGSVTAVLAAAALSRLPEHAAVEARWLNVWWPTSGLSAELREMKNANT